MLNLLPGIDDYNLSIILPFYKKLAEFKCIFPNKAKYFQRKGIELLIVMDENSEKDGLLEYIKLYPEISWKVIMNSKPHPWRNPAFASNVGLRFAEKEYVMVSDPEFEFFTDVIYLLRAHLECYPGHFAVGYVYFAGRNEIITESNLHSKFFIPYGVIMAKCEDFFRITGYTESFLLWGGEDDNVRARLQMSGIRKIYVPSAKMIHREEYPGQNKERSGKTDKIPIAKLRELLYPDHIIANDHEWGKDFDNLIFQTNHS